MLTLRALYLLRHRRACPVAAAVLCASCSPFTCRQELHQFRHDVSSDEGSSQWYNRQNRTCRDSRVLNVCLQQATVNEKHYLSGSNIRPLLHSTLSCAYSRTVSGVGVIRFNGAIASKTTHVCPRIKRQDNCFFNVT
jgi:hypothetical protein